MDQPLPQIIITTDGAARGNPGPGGWAALLEANGRSRLISGEGPEHTTNNAMEIYALVAALASLKRPCQVHVRSDSQYLIEGYRRLMAGANLPEKNRALWQQLREVAQPHTIEFEWVRGHAGDPRNEQVDQAANAAANRALLLVAPTAAPSVAGEHWVLAVLSPAADRPVQWALHGQVRLSAGNVALVGITQPTAVWQALAAGLAAAAAMPGASTAAVEVLSNYELIIKQGRGEWKVKNPEQQAIARQVGELRAQFGAVTFNFANTKQVSELIGEISA